MAQVISGDGGALPYKIYIRVFRKYGRQENIKRPLRAIAPYDPPLYVYTYTHAWVCVCVYTYNTSVCKFIASTHPTRVFWTTIARTHTSTPYERPPAAAVLLASALTGFTLSVVYTYIYMIIIGSSCSNCSSSSRSTGPRRHRSWPPVRVLVNMNTNFLASAVQLTDHYYDTSIKRVLLESQFLECQ